jgi:hypothetical protein
MISGANHQGQDLVLLAPTVITTAAAGTTTTPVKFQSGANYFGVHCKLVYGSGGTTIKVWVQTSLDGGLTWTDIMNFAHTTASLSRFSAVNNYPSTPLPPVTALTDATLADNTVLTGLLGQQVRLKFTTTGTYGGATTLSLYGVIRA